MTDRFHRDRKRTAGVFIYDAPERVTIYCNCNECGIEWGWARSTPENKEMLEEMAERHNIEEHRHQP